MSLENNRLLDLCRRVTDEKDARKLAEIIGELDQELDQQPAKKPPHQVPPQLNRTSG